MAERVRITHPRTAAARRPPHRTTTREIDDETELGELYMASLVRSQRRLAIVACGVVAAFLVGTALLGAFAPGLSRVRVLGVPLPWALLGVAIYPALIAVAALTVRQAERNEAAFSALVNRPPEDPR